MLGGGHGGQTEWTLDADLLLTRDSPTNKTPSTFVSDVDQLTETIYNFLQLFCRLKVRFYQRYFIQKLLWTNGRMMIMHARFISVVCRTTVNQVCKVQVISKKYSKSRANIVAKCQMIKIQMLHLAKSRKQVGRFKPFTNLSPGLFVKSAQKRSENLDNPTWRDITCIAADAPSESPG